MTDISGAMPRLDFRMMRAGDGAPVTGTDYRGKVVALYFGYTNCPDVCPATLANLTEMLGKVKSRDVLVLFVSVDPARDTPDVMRTYVNAFDPRAVGLTGDPRMVEALVKRYRSSFTREPASTGGNYEVSHGSAIYLFDRDGHARALATPAASQDDIVHDLHLLLDTGAAP